MLQAFSLFSANENGKWMQQDLSLSYFDDEVSPLKEWTALDDSTKGIGLY